MLGGGGEGNWVFLKVIFQNRILRSSSKITRWVCFNDPAWESFWVGGVEWVVWLTPTTYIQLAGAGSMSKIQNGVVCITLIVMGIKDLKQTKHIFYKIR